MPGIIARGLQRNAGDPFADRYYSGSDGATFASLAGTTITEASARSLSAVSGCLWILGEAAGQLSLFLYDRVTGPDGKDAGKEKASGRLAYVLHDQPNEEQSTFEFVCEMTQWAALYPYVIAEVKRDNSGEVEQVIPRHPSRIKRERLANGKLRYQYREDDNRTWRAILREDTFRLPGKDILNFGRQSFGMALAVDQFGGSSFRNGIRPMGWIGEDPKSTMTPQARAEFMRALLENHGGPNQSGGVPFLPDGLKFNQVGMTHEQAEYVASKTFAIQDVARWFRIAPYMLGVVVQGAMSYASVEMQSLEFVIFTLMPWLRRWEGAIQRDLILAKETQFAEFLTAGLMRGTTKERFEAYQIAVSVGWLDNEEVRRLENLNPRPIGYVPPMKNVSPAALVEGDSPAGRLLSLLITDNAGAVVRKEAAAMSRAADRLATDEPAWRMAVTDFYLDHPKYVASKMRIPLSAAQRYSRTQRDELLTEGPSVIPAWEAARVDDLTALALEQEALVA